MEIKNKIATLLLSLVLIMTACSETKQRETEKKGDEKWIAQHIVQEDNVEERIPTIAEFTAIDKGFSILDTAIKAANFTKVSPLLTNLELVLESVSNPLMFFKGMVVKFLSSTFFCSTVATAPLLI